MLSLCLVMSIFSFSIADFARVGVELYDEETGEFKNAPAWKRYLLAGSAATIGTGLVVAGVWAPTRNVVKITLRRTADSVHSPVPFPQDSIATLYNPLSPIAQKFLRQKPRSVPLSKIHLLGQLSDSPKSYHPRSPRPTTDPKTGVFSSLFGKVFPSAEPSSASASRKKGRYGHSPIVVEGDRFSMSLKTIRADEPFSTRGAWCQDWDALERALLHVDESRWTARSIQAFSQRKAPSKFVIMVLPNISSTESSGRAPRIDRFSRLPNELLRRIFTLAYAKNTPSAPLSRRLRPFYDAVAFRALKAGNDARVHSLNRNLTGRPGLGQAVRQLVIEEAGTKSRLGFDDINALFASLTNLQYLGLGVRDSSWVDAVLPNTPEAKTILPASIVSLVIVAPGDRRRDAYDPAQLGALTQLPNLTALSLDFRSKYQGLEQPSSAASELSLPDVTDLSVGLPKGFSSVNSLLGCFPHLHKLGITSHAAEPTFASALASVKSPAEIKELTIKASPKKGWRFPDELAAFSSLKSLVLAGQLQHLEENAYKVLERVPLTSLAVGKKSDIDAEVLTALLGKEGLCPTIKTLRLDNLVAKGPSEDELDAAIDDGELFSIPYYFVLPTWSAAFPYGWYCSLAGVAAQAGVALTGSTVKAAELVERYLEVQQMIDEADVCGEECCGIPIASGADRFSTLAPELLRRIFSFAYEEEGDRPAKAPLSRSLRPFYDAIAFKSIRIHDRPRCQALVKTITTRPALGCAVRAVHVSNSAAATPLETDDICALLRLLPNLHAFAIRVHDSACLEAVFPLREGAQTSLPKTLKSLDVSSSQPSVALDFPGGSKASVDPSLADYSLPNLGSLSVGVHDASSSGALLESFPHLRKLTLRDQHSTLTCDFSPILARIRSPEEIVELSLEASPPHGWRFPNELTSLRSLQTLELSGNFQQVTTRDYGVLRLAPISTLRVNKDCDISAAALKALLGSRGGCPTLKTLNLDNLSAAYPEGVKAGDVSGGRFYLCDRAGGPEEAKEFLWEWTLPQWTTKFSASAYNRLVKAAAAHDVTLTGSTVLAKEIDRDWLEVEDEVLKTRRIAEEEEGRSLSPYESMR
ncbi:hypothetical protein JCM3774_000508 [Rhodotorula dairenensis]